MLRKSIALHKLSTVRCKCGHCNENVSVSDVCDNNLLLLLAGNFINKIHVNTPVNMEFIHYFTL